MLRSRLSRAVALASAMLASLSAPAIAVAHGHVHEHLVSQHHVAATAPQHRASIADAEDHHAVSHDEQGEKGHTILTTVDPSSVGVSQPSEDEHQHGHPALSAIAAARDLIRVHTAPIVAVATPPAVLVQTTIRVVRSAHQANRSTLARPDPEQGPPPTLRAPPIA